MLPKDEILHNKTSLNYGQLQYSLFYFENYFPVENRKSRALKWENQSANELVLDSLITSELLA